MSKKDLRNFEPLLFARLDREMWQAYYRHDFLTLFRLLIKLCYTYCRPNPMLTILTAYHSAQAAIIFRKTKHHENLPAVEHHLEQFYSMLSGHDIRPFDYIKAAKKELEWWMVDRYPERYSEDRATALAAGMAVIYQMDAAALQVYGTKRADAMMRLGRHHDDKSVVPNWAEIDALLAEAYEGLHKAVNV